MLRLKKWAVVLAMFMFCFTAEVIVPGNITGVACAQADKMPACVAAVAVADETTEPVETIEEKCVETLAVLNTEEVWMDAYNDLMYAEENEWRRLLVAEAKEFELTLMSNSTDHVANYHGRRFAITDDDYQVLLKIVEAEAPHEDILGKMLVANVVLNRLEQGFWGNTISEVVFARNQFEPISNGSFFSATPSDTTIEAVGRALNGEDESQGALYFMSRTFASKRGIYWFDNNLNFLFRHGGHEFYTEKN